MLSVLFFLITGTVLSFGIYTLVIGLVFSWSNYFPFIFIPVIGIPICYLVAFFLYMLIAFFVGLCVDVSKNKDKPSKFYQLVVYICVKQLRFLCGARIKKSGFDKLPKEGPVLYIYNHRSNWDPMMIMSELPKRLICITKASNKKIPIAGPHVHLAGYISIDRENNREALKSILLAIKFVDKYHQSIAISPEGTRNKDLSTPLLPFHAGSFKIATKTNIPIVLIGFKNIENIRKNFPWKATKCNMDIIDVLYPEDYKDLDTVEIANKTQTMFEKYLGKEN